MNKNEKIIPYTAAERAEILLKRSAYAQELEELEAAGKLEELRELAKKDRALKKEYKARLPRREFGRCPFCYATYEQAIDPFGYDGTWWYSKFDDAKKSCEHLRVTRCATDLKGHRAKVPEDLPRKFGPAAPYVIPRMFELPNVICVISGMKLEAGYTFYPLMYFSEQPIANEDMCLPWAGNNTGQGYKNERWDFDLRPWVESGHVRWCDFNDKGQAVLQPKEPDLFPFYDLPGHRGPQVADWNGQFYEHDLPPESHREF